MEGKMKNIEKFDNFLQKKVLSAVQSRRIDFNDYAYAGMTQREIIDFVTDEFIEKAMTSHLDGTKVINAENSTSLTHEFTIHGLSDENKAVVKEYSKTLNYFKFFKEYPCDFPDDAKGVEAISDDLAKFVAKTWPEDKKIHLYFSSSSKRLNLKLYNQIIKKYFNKRLDLKAQKFCKENSRFEQLVAICRQHKRY